MSLAKRSLTLTEREQTHLFRHKSRLKNRLDGGQKKNFNRKAAEVLVVAGRGIEPLIPP
jgi:hypothetical protein